MSQQFGQFTASELFCPKCQRSQPVRERLLLILPTGELHEFVCKTCGSSLGERTTSGPTVSRQNSVPGGPEHRPVKRRLLR